MRSLALLFIVAFTARYVKEAEAHCGLAGCGCSSLPYETCCSGYTCGQQGTCVEVVTVRDEFIYPYPYDLNSYGYTEFGVPGYKNRYTPPTTTYGYTGGSPGFGNNFVGTNFGVGHVPWSEFFYSGF